MRLYTHRATGLTHSPRDRPRNLFTSHARRDPTRDFVSHYQRDFVGDSSRDCASHSQRDFVVKPAAGTEGALSK